jgi:CheY-like chemotaxis protein
MSSPHHAHGHVILLVEDFESIRVALAQLLELEGHHVAAVPDALDGLHLLRSLALRPCLIISDLSMPAIDGFAFYSELRKDPESDLAGIPVIALTAHEDLRRQAVAGGFAAALLKPCSLHELFRLIDQHCSTTSHRVQIRLKKP